MYVEREMNSLKVLVDFRDEAIVAERKQEEERRLRYDKMKRDKARMQMNVVAEQPGTSAATSHLNVRTEEEDVHRDEGEQTGLAVAFQTSC